MLYFSRLLFSGSGQLQREATSRSNQTDYGDKLISIVILWADVGAIYSHNVVEKWGSVGVYWILKWLLLWAMIRHVISYYLWDLIDKICGWFGCFQGLWNAIDQAQGGIDDGGNAEKDELLLLKKVLWMGEKTKITRIRHWCNVILIVHFISLEIFVYLYL